MYVCMHILDWYVYMRIFLCRKVCSYVCQKVCVYMYACMHISGQLRTIDCDKAISATADMS